MSFIEVILPLPIPGTFTYSLPPRLVTDQLTGTRVVVQFGKRKIYTGIVYAVHEVQPENYKPKPALDLIDDKPIVTPTQLKFFEWISKYYMCSLGEVVNAAIPAGLKMSSDSYISINPEVDPEELELSENEAIIIRQLNSGDLMMRDISKILNIKSPYHYIKRLKERNAIQVFEQIKDKFSPKKETRIKLAENYLDEDLLDELLKELEKKKKQTEMLLAYLSTTGALENPLKNKDGVSKKDLLSQGLSESSLKTLIKNGIFVQWEKTVSRLQTDQNEQFVKPLLSEAQEQAKADILNAFQKHDTVLLKGITGSGKTEIYISLILDIIENGGQVLYLLPEIALTTQIISRLARVFGNQFGVYHSRYSDNERVEVWQKVLKGEYRFVVGVRSAIFLPFSDLALTIVDEEHENTFKQYEPAPRYHARDAAIYLGSVFFGKTLLGSATPALESYHNALNGKYGLVTLNERYRQVKLPDIRFADITKERKQRKLRGNFTSQLLDEINATLDSNKQVILFQNRRGYAPYVSCDNCGYIPKCPHCDVSLTYHIHQHFLICHYCGHKTGMITECIQCNSRDIRSMSFGTEKIEEELEILIPTARIRRMDLDSTRSKYSYQRIIDDFETGNIDILIGTQMVSKGLDFDNVELVGVFDADRMIHFPDFRSHERAYQLIHQVSGRSGRRSNQGRVIIQTSNPDQPLLQFVKRQDYNAFFAAEISERERFHYPPFYRMINIRIKDADKQTAADAAQFYAREIRRELGVMRVIGPVEPIIGKIRNQYLYDVTVKLEKQGLNIPALKEFLLTSRNMLLSQRLYKGVRVIFDVDPV